MQEKKKTAERIQRPYLTEHFAILRPHNPPVHQFYAIDLLNLRH